MENTIISPFDLKYCQLTPLHQLTKGFSVYRQNDIAQGFYFIKEGLIGLYHTLDNGKESLVRLYCHGEYFGFRTLFDFAGESRYHCNAKVLIEANIIRITPENIELFFLHNIKLGQYLIQKLANELRDAEQRLAKSAYLRTLDRVMDSLSFLTSNFPYYNWTYREIAEYAGCETETAIRIAKALKKNKLFSDRLHHYKSK